MKSSAVYIIAILLMLGQIRCDNTSTGLKLKTGDIFFCSYQSGDLSSAIDEVTQTKKETHYSHMGLIEVSNADTFVIHASLKRGVVKEPLQSFLIEDEPSVFDVYRLNDGISIDFMSVVESADKLVGLPYNPHYLMNDTCFYCSQLVYKVFKSVHAFQLEPMTFKNPNTNDFNDGWIKHYQALEMEIPEGEPGCNPNGLAASENLMFVGSL